MKHPTHHEIRNALADRGAMTPLEASAAIRIMRLAGQSACYEAGIRRAIVALEFGNIDAALTQLRAALLVVCIADGGEDQDCR